MSVNKSTRNQISLKLEPEAFRFKQLRAAHNPEEFAIHRAALEWSLDAPITIRNEQDILSRRDWADRFDPFAHQIQNLITFCRRAPVTLLADDVGLGKTISAGLIISELMARRRIDRVLVVAPKLLLPQWQEELGTKFRIPAATASGKGFSEEIRRQVPIVVTTYQTLGRYIDELRDANFDMIVLDEAHKLRNLHGTSKPPQMAIKVRKALADRWFKYTLMLTATPIMMRLWDLYSLVDILTAAKGHVNPLGSPELFLTDYLEDKKAMKLKRGRREMFRRHVSSYIVRTRRSDAKLVFPERTVVTHKVRATVCETKIIRIIGKLFQDDGIKLNGLMQSSIGQALMSSPIALLDQLERMASNSNIPMQVVEDIRNEIQGGDPPGKLVGLLKLIKELSAQRPTDWRMVVFTARKKTQDLIGDAVREAGHSVGFIRGGKAAENERAIRRFKENPPGVRVLVSTDAGAEGINLQASNVLVNFDLPWNPMVLEQRIGRVQRLASQHAEVKILNLVLAGSVEEKVVGRLSERLQIIAESIGDIEAILDSMGGENSESDPIEHVIRSIVIESLRGVDPEESTLKAMASIEEAKQMFEAGKETVERTLGDLTDLHRKGPSIPEITPVEPSIKPRDFVLRALRADGAAIHAIDSDVLSVNQSGQTQFQITFKDRRYDGALDTGVFGSTAPRLFIPGKRDFERLSQSWSEKAAAFVVDRSRPKDNVIEAELTAWLLQQAGATLTDFEIEDRKAVFAGNLVCRSSIANRVDRLEKLVEVLIIHDSGPELDPPFDGESASLASIDYDDLGKALDNLVADVADSVDEDADLAKFNTFYQQRLDEELAKAENPTAAKQIIDQFAPMLAAEAVGISGVQSVVLIIVAHSRFKNYGPYPLKVKLVPQANRFDIEWNEAFVTYGSPEKTLPLSVTDVSSVSGERAPKWEFALCKQTGKLALPHELVRCEISGDSLHPETIAMCDLTGKYVRKDLLRQSDVSGRWATESEFNECEFTGNHALLSELAFSEVSNKRYRSDQTAQSVISGKSGHDSEFVHSVDPDGLLERSLAAQSDVSGNWALADRLIASEHDSARRGVLSEVVRSSVSGKMLLLDEIVVSDLSGAAACPGELIQCEFTKANCLPTEIIKSELSGKLFRGDQKKRSSISQRTGHDSEFVRSVRPLGWIAHEEAGQSAVSGQWADRSFLVGSQRAPHRIGLPSELVRCDVSERQLLSDEVRASAVSGRSIDKDLLIRSSASERFALPEEFIACEHTGAMLCPDELAECAISKKLTDLRRLVASQESGLRGYEPLMQHCAVSEGKLLPIETVRCAISGQTVSKRAASECLVTGRWAITDRMAESPGTGARYIDDAQTHKQVPVVQGASGPLVACQWSGATVLIVETMPCSISGLRVMIEFLSSNNELTMCREILEGRQVDGSFMWPDHELKQMKKKFIELRGATAGTILASPSGSFLVGCIAARSGFLKLVTEYRCIVFEKSYGKIISCTAGARSNGRWGPVL